MSGLTIFGGHGFVGTVYTKAFYDAAIGNIASVNGKEDHIVYSEDVLYLLSTVDNYNVFTDVHIDINTNLNTLMTVLKNWKQYQEETGKKGTFNFVSSWSVYGNQGLNINEATPCDPKGFYIITKRCAEQLLISYCETFSLQYRILRLGNVVGPGDKKVSNKKNILQHNINLLAKGQNVELYGNGCFYRDFIHVEDVVSAIDLVLCKGEVNEIYNIGNGLPFLFYRGILEYVRKKLDSPGDIVFKEPTEFQKRVPVPTFYMNNDKLLRLGYQPKYTGTALYDTLLPEEIRRG